MTTAFPTALDAFTNPTPSTSMAAVRTHSEQHGDLNDAVEALQAKVGINDLPAGGVSRSAQAKLKEIIHVTDFGTLGTANDAAVIQLALTYVTSLGGGTLVFPRKGNFISGPLIIGGNTILEMNNSTITAIATLGAGQSLLSNLTVTGAVNATIDDNICVRNGAFVCTIAADRTVALVAFSKCGDLRLDDITITGGRYNGLLIYGCKRVWVDRPKISGTGKVVVSIEGGPGILITTHYDGSTSDDIHILSPHIFACEWAGIYTQGNRVTIRNPHIFTVKEAGIFGTSNGLEISGGFISNITRKYISAAGIELGGINCTIGGGIAIDTVDNCGIALTDTTNFNLGNFRTSNVRRDAVTFPTASHVAVISTVASPNMPRDIIITGHSAIDYSSPSYSAVQINGQGAGAAMVNVKISDNNYSGTAWTSGKAVFINTVYWTAASCDFSSNFGNLDTVRSVLAYLAPSQSLTTATPTAISFAGALNNEEGRWAGGSPTRITALKTDKKVRIVGAVNFAANATGFRAVQIFKNGATYTGAGESRTLSCGATDPTIVTCESPWMDVVAGDYFTLIATQASGGALNAQTGNAGCWIAAEFK